MTETVCISLPGSFLDTHFQRVDYISITDAIGAIAKDAIVKDTTASQLLNLSLIVLSLERSHAGNWIQLFPPAGELELPDW